MAARFDSFAQKNTTTRKYDIVQGDRNMVAADQIVDSCSTNTNSNNDREVDDGFKRANEVLESSKAYVFHANLFLYKKQKRAPEHEALQKSVLQKNKTQAKMMTLPLMGHAYDALSALPNPYTPKLVHFAEFTRDIFF